MLSEGQLSVQRFQQAAAIKSKPAFVSITVAEKISGLLAGLGDADVYVAVEQDRLSAR